MLCPIKCKTGFIWVSGKNLEVMDNGEVLVKGNSVSLRISASTDNLTKEKLRNLTLHLG